MRTQRHRQLESLAQGPRAIKDLSPVSLTPWPRLLMVKLISTFGHSDHLHNAPDDERDPERNQIVQAI